MTQPIVVAVAPGPEADAAVALGAGVARLLRAPLVLAAVALRPAMVDASVVPGWTPAAADEEERLRRVRAPAERHLDALPAEVTATVAATCAATVVAGLDGIAEAQGAQLLVVGASHLGRLGRTLRGDVALDALRHAPCAVLVAPAAGGGAALEHGAPHVIGVAWDDTPEADEALTAAVALSARAGSELHVIHAGRDTDAAARAVAAASRCVAARAVCVPDASPTSLLRERSAGLDLLVMGSRRAGPLGRVAFGSVSAAVAGHAACPVLVIPRGAVSPSSANYGSPAWTAPDGGAPGRA